MTHGNSRRARKVDDTVVAEIVGAGQTIERALTIRDETGGVNETLWSTVDQTHQKIGYAQSFALDQLGSIAGKLEGTKVRLVADAARLAEREVPKWLAVLARCFQLQVAIDVLELDRVIAEQPQQLDDYRRGLKKTRELRRESVLKQTGLLLERMEAAVEAANARIVWNRTKTHEVIGSANRLATQIDDFHGLLRIEAGSRTWEVRELDRFVALASKAVQGTKDKGPTAAAAFAGVVTIGLGAKKYSDADRSEAESENS